MKSVDTLSQRVLLLTPIGRDAPLIADVLRREGIDSVACRGVEELARCIAEGAAAAVVAEEALVGVPLDSLLLVFAGQPSWSDFPLLLLTCTGQEASATTTRLLGMSGGEVNITILERPIRVPTLHSSVRSAIRARRRQYEVRDYLAERRDNQEKLLQKQKMESLGVLAGGIAHDFNNLLTGILGNASLALETLPPGAPAVGLLDDVVQASERAAHLTKQLLAYAGKGRFFLESIDLSALVRDVSQLIRTSIPGNARLRLELAEALPCVQGDGAQLQQLVMNLVINAAEAIPPGRAGEVAVTTKSQRVDAEYLSRAGAVAEVVPGEYVALQVQDDGVGMDEGTAQRIFDPFFSTKFTGRGLGLAATQGIVKGHKGLLTVSTAPGQGSTFNVLFPAAGPYASEVAPRPAPLPAGKQHGMILVIDDEEVVRRTAKAALERAGYNVIVAEDGTEGIRLFAAVKAKVAVVLLDLTMPGLGGEDVLREIRAMKPEACVILSSGYNEVEVIRRFTGSGLAGFLQKPYAGSALLEKVNAALRMDPTKST
jgi:signal transduction histidine kinase/CheY-like chemotaxis protein